MTTSESAPDPTAGERRCRCEAGWDPVCPVHPGDPHNGPATPGADDASAECLPECSDWSGHVCPTSYPEVRDPVEQVRGRRVTEPDLDWTASTGASEPLTPIEECIDADALIEAMIHAGAWAVIEASMDTADREPGKALVEQTVADVRTWLAAREAAAATKARADERNAWAHVVRNHDMPPKKDTHGYAYRMGWWDAILYADHIISRGVRACEDCPGKRRA